jgi:hypothetical protein
MFRRRYSPNSGILGAILSIDGDVPIEGNSSAGECTALDIGSLPRLLSFKDALVTRSRKGVTVTIIWAVL